jgi:uncharacterized protein
LTGCCCQASDPAEEVHVSVGAPRRAVSLDDVRRHREQIVEIGRRFGVRNIRVFGSVARGDAGTDSDLDLLIDVDPGHGYFDMAGFALEVEDLLGVFTQVATVGGMKVRIRDRVLAEAVGV